MTVRDNCPYVSSDVGLKLIQELEAAEMENKKALRNLELNNNDNKKEMVVTVDRLAKIFPEAPRELLATMCTTRDFDTTRLPWNRRFAKAEALVVHLFSVWSHQSWWDQGMRRKFECLNVYILKNQDVLNDDVWSYLMMLVRTGRVMAILAGPPCRTVSVARYKQDNGPKPVKSRTGSQRWGLHTNAPSEQKEAKLYNKEVKALVETPEDPKTYRGDRDDYATLTCWPEVVKVLEEVLQLKRISLDQGALQHPRRKPTCLWSNFPMVMELDGLLDRLDGRDPWPEDIPTALRLSKSTAAWAPMLKDVIIRSLHELPLPQPQLGGDVPELRAMGLTEEESWYLHIMADHTPYRKDCLHECQVGAGRDRP